MISDLNLLSGYKNRWVMTFSTAQVRVYRLAT